MYIDKTNEELLCVDEYGNKYVVCDRCGREALPDKDGYVFDFMIYDGQLMCGDCHDAY